MNKLGVVFEGSGVNVNIEPSTIIPFFYTVQQIVMLSLPSKYNTVFDDNLWDGNHDPVLLQNHANVRNDLI